MPRRSHEDIPPRPLADGHDRGVADLPLDRDGVKALQKGLGAPDELHFVALPHFRLEHAWGGEDAEPCLPKDLRQRGVIHLTDHLGSDVLGSEPLLQRATEHRVATWQEEGHAVERAGEPPSAGLGKLRGGEEGGTGLAEQMIERAHGRAGAHRRVREHDVNGERGLRSGDALTQVLTNHYLVTTCPAEHLQEVVEAIRPILRKCGGVCLVSDASWVLH